MSDPTWWIVQTDMGKVIFHGADKERAERVATMHMREAEPLYPASVVTALQEEVTRHRAALADERKRALEEAAKALDAWGDIYGDNAAKTVRALKETTK